MKRIYVSFQMCILVLILLSCAAHAQEVLTLSAEALSVGEALGIEANDDAERRAFILFRDGEQVNTGALTEARHAALLPQTPGQYVLTAVPEGGQPVSAAFTVYDRLTVNLSADYMNVCAGETLTLTADAAGGTPEKTYEYSIWRGNERIGCETSAKNRFEYIPLEEGTLTFSVLVKDQLGSQVSAVTDPVTVRGTAGLTVSGSLSPLFVQGGIRGLTVESPGPWSAVAEQDCVALLNACGNSGDTLYYAVSASGVGERSAVIRISSMGLSRRVVLRQSAEYAEETEVTLFGADTDWIRIEGQAAFSYLCGAEESVCTAAIEASGTWHADTDSGFVHLQQADGRLVMRVDENTAGEHRTAYVYVHCGGATAAISISQVFEDRRAAVREVVMDRERGRAYLDEVALRITTDRTAANVSVTVDQNAPIVFDGSHSSPSDDGLQWRITVPLTGAGAQSWLISADNELGSGAKALATVSVEGEQPAFAGLITADETNMQMIAWVTQGTERIEALDGKGHVLAAYTPQNARVDRVVDDQGRYASWTMPVSGEKPVALRIGDQRQEVHFAMIDTPEGAFDEGQPAFELYSQMDGTWKNKSYRKSNLEHSGCAIFALSHALQLLGHQEPESKPEQLAVTYAFCLVDGGTLNSTLIGNAGKVFGYKTRFKLYTDKKEITRRFKQGAMFSFGIVNGHIALTDRLSEDGTMCHIIDSAPSATFSRITGETPYLYNEKSGRFVPLASPAEIPGVRYYVDTEGYDGAEYWLPLSYVAERGVRLIQKK